MKLSETTRKALTSELKELDAQRVAIERSIAELANLLGDEELSVAPKQPPRPPLPRARVARRLPEDSFISRVRQLMNDGNWRSASRIRKDLRLGKAKGKDVSRAVSVLVIRGEAQVRGIHPKREYRKAAVSAPKQEPKKPAGRGDVTGAIKELMGNDWCRGVDIVKSFPEPQRRSAQSILSGAVGRGWAEKRLAGSDGRLLEYRLLNGAASHVTTAEYRPSPISDD